MVMFSFRMVTQRRNVRQTVFDTQDEPSKGWDGAGKKSSFRKETDVVDNAAAHSLV